MSQIYYRRKQGQEADRAVEIAVVTSQSETAMRNIGIHTTGAETESGSESQRVIIGAGTTMTVVNTIETVVATDILIQDDVISIVL